MNPRVCAATAAILGVLATAGSAGAAEPGYGPGRGSIGGQLGVSSFRMDRILGGNTWFGDYSAGALSRPQFTGQFRYVLTPSLRVQVSPGMTWAAYKGDERAPFEDPRFPGDVTKVEHLAVMVPVSVQAQYIVRRGWWLYHLGLGPGIYRVWVQNRREVLKDPLTLRLHRGLYPGASGELGVELFLRQLTTTSIELAIGGDLAFAERPEQFPSGYNSHVLAVGIRLGGNYYFNPGGRKKEAAAPAP